MDSPEGDRIAATSSPASSPPVQESPLFSFLSNLSPIKSVKAARYAQRFLDSDFPTPPPVFTSPHINLQREPSFLKRDENDAAGTDIHGQSDRQLKDVLMPSFQKEVQSCNCSPSVCVDEYLADAMDVEDSMNSVNLCLQPTSGAPQLLQSGFTGPEVAITEVDDANDNNTRAAVKNCSVQAEEDLTMGSMHMVETAVNQRNDERFGEVLEFPSKEVSDHVESDIFQDPVSGAEHHGQYVTQVSQNVKLQSAGGQGNKWNGSCAESSRQVSKGSFKEANQHQRGTRRHLQFEAAMASKRTTFCNSHSSCNVTHNTTNSGLTASHTNLESLLQPHVSSSRQAVSCAQTITSESSFSPSEFDSCNVIHNTTDSGLPASHTNLESLLPPHVSSSRQPVSCAQTITSQSSFSPPEFVRPTQKGGNHSISAPFPSGIGLHLNSIARSVIVGSDMIANNKLSSYMSSQDGKLVTERSHSLAKDSNTTSISAVASEIYVHVEDDQPGSQAVLTTSSDTSQSTKSMKSPCDSLHMTLFEQQVAPYEGRMLASEHTDLVEELNQVSPRRKRRNSESDGCKRCNCKRSKCLKLYCECFAAGVYCVDSCACENCFNKPEYEDTVLDTRQQIESRNPLAFAPKIVQHATDSPANVVEDGRRTTPSSARHKRGCNCKKSKCLKKYCECYQANVGCSDGCRCDCCHNPFGKKPESMYRRAERERNPSHEKLDTAETVTDCIEAGTTNQFSSTWEELGDLSHLTPLSNPHLGVVASSASSNVRDCLKVTQAQSQPQSTLQSTSYLRWRCSPMSLSKAPHELSSDSALYDILKDSDDDMPELLKDSSTPTRAVKISSPNQKRVSPPQFRSQESRSICSPGLRSGRKFILQAVPSFPPLTPYSNSKDDNTEKESDHLGSTSNQ